LMWERAMISTIDDVAECPPQVDLEHLAGGHLSVPLIGPMLRHLAVCSECKRIADDLARAAAHSDATGPVPASGGALDPRRQFGRYQIQWRLGVGGMATVYLARDLLLDRLVALKIPDFGPDATEVDRERFFREAQAAASLSHRGLCPVYDSGVVNGTPFLAAAYIDGKPLSERISSGTTGSIDSAVKLVREIATVMHAAHEQGVIHRDLKPSNIMIDEAGLPVITDFGLAWRRHQGLDERLTASGMIIGTPGYMPPEQLKSRDCPIQPTYDVYSLGVVLYELLTGQLPFTGTIGEMMAKILRDPPVPPSALRSDLSLELDDICLKALEKDPSKRFATMLEFASALERHGRPAPVYQGDVPVRSQSTLVVQRPAQTTADRESRDLFLSAQYHLEKRVECSHRKSIAIYYKLLDQNPALAPAWAGLANAYHLLGVREYTAPTNASPKGKCAARRALGLDETLGEAHCTLAMIRMEYEWDLAGALDDFRRVLELAPESAVAYQLYGKCLACLGQHADAIEALRKAEELDPLSANISTAIGRYGYFPARQYTRAVEQYKKTIETDPNFWLAHSYLGWVFAVQGRHQDAINTFAAARALSDDPRVLAGHAYALAVAGERVEAQRTLEMLMQWREQRYVSPSCLAFVYTGLKEMDQAFHWLETAVQDRSECMCEIRVHPVLDPLRSDPRFDSVIQRLEIKA
jgi:serine/threonine protein kinase